jgi:predicted RNA-binding Zn-ribbon protein involved in translation (DUF1610 family)
MITSSGPKCDVCGNYILPLDPEERVNFFDCAQIPERQLHACNKCKALLEALPQGEEGNWKQLPDGPMRQAFQKAADAKAQAECPLHEGMETVYACAGCGRSDNTAN